MNDIFTILIGLKVAIFLSILAMATMEMMMNKRRMSTFGLLLMAIAFLTMGITELLFLISENGASNFTFTLDMGFMNTLFLIAGGLGLILYFSGLKPHKK